MKHYPLYGIAMLAMLAEPSAHACEAITCLLTKNGESQAAQKITLACQTDPEESRSFHYGAGWANEEGKFFANLFYRYQAGGNGSPSRTQAFNLRVAPKAEEFNGLSYAALNNVYPIPDPAPEQAEVEITIVAHSGKMLRYKVSCPNPKGEL